jgi:tyrosyl-tRNA synthetase
MFNILDDLNYRGLIKDYSNEENIAKLLSTKATIYCGFDPSASSMHIGNFVMISILMRLQRAGHRIIAVVGGGTGMIGDPSGKSKERNLLTEEGVCANASRLKEQLSRFLDLSDHAKGMLVDNYDRLSKISLIEYLRDYAKYFNVSYMLAKDIISSRLDSGISLTEFTYMTLQSIDFLHLFETYGCSIQIGGSDQWGNLTAGIDFIHKLKGPDVEVECMTSNLITRSDGKKFGKSEDGALFLDRNLTSPYKLYQFFYNQSDDDSVKYLKVFTFLSKEEIEAIAKDHYAHLGARIAQKKLAYEVVKIIHSEADAEDCVKMSEALFSSDFKNLSERNIAEVFAGYEVPLAIGKNLEDVLLEVKAASSKREAREFLKNGAISLNGDKVLDGNTVIDDSFLLYGKYLIIRRGKKNYYLGVTR